MQAKRRCMDKQREHEEGERDKKRRRIEEESEQEIMTSLEDIPPEIIVLILHASDFVSKIVVRFVCRSWRDLLPTPSEIAHAYPTRWGRKGRPPKFAQEAAKEGSIPILRWAAQNGCPFKKSSIFNSAAAGGNVAVLDWLKNEMRCPCSPFDAAVHAVKNGRREAVEWLLMSWDVSEEKLMRHGGIWCAAAAAEGQLEMLKWLKEKLPSWSSYDKVPIFAKASEGGNLALIQWMHDSMMDEKEKEGLKKMERDEDGSTHSYFMNFAAKRGHMDVVKWMKEKGFICDHYTCSQAASSGRLDLVKWLLANGCSWEMDGSTFMCACRSMSLEDIKWLKENGCPTVIYATKEAAKRESYDVLKWLKYEVGFKIEREALDIAALKGRIEILEWLKEEEGLERLGVDPWLLDAILRSKANVAMAKWLVANGCKWDSDTFPSAIEGDKYNRKKGIDTTEVLKWLRGLGCPWDADCFTTAVRVGNLKVVEWMHENGCPWDFMAYCVAERQGKHEIAKWLTEKGCGGKPV